MNKNLSYWSTNLIQNSNKYLDFFGRQLNKQKTKNLIIKDKQDWK